MFAKSLCYPAVMETSFISCGQGQNDKLSTIFAYTSCEVVTARANARPSPEWNSTEIPTGDVADFDKNDNHRLRPRPTVWDT